MRINRHVISYAHSVYNDLSERHIARDAHCIIPKLAKVWSMCHPQHIEPRLLTELDRFSQRWQKIWTEIRNIMPFQLWMCVEFSIHVCDVMYVHKISKCKDASFFFPLRPYLYPKCVRVILLLLYIDFDMVTLHPQQAASKLFNSKTKLPIFRISWNFAAL